VEPECSLPCSKEPAVGLYPESHESGPHLQTVFLLRSILKLSSHLRLYRFHVVYCLQVYRINFVCILILFVALHIPLISYPWFDNTDKSFWGVQTMELFMWCFPNLHHFFSLRSKYSPQHSVIKNLEFFFFFWIERSYSRTTQNNRWNSIFLTCTLTFKFQIGDGKTNFSKILDRLKLCATDEIFSHPVHSPSWRTTPCRKIIHEICMEDMGYIFRKIRVSPLLNCLISSSSQKHFKEPCTVVKINIYLNF